MSISKKTILTSVCSCFSRFLCVSDAVITCDWWDDFFFCFRRIFLWLVVYTWVAVIFGTVRQDFQIILERMWWRFSVVWTLDCVILSGWLNQTSTWLVSESYGLFLYPLLSGMLVLPSNRVYPTSLLLFTNIVLIAMLQNSDILINIFLNFVLIFSFHKQVYLWYGFPGRCYSVWFLQSLILVTCAYDNTLGFRSKVRKGMDDN